MCYYSDGTWNSAYEEIFPFLSQFLALIGFSLLVKGKQNIDSSMAISQTNLSVLFGAMESGQFHPVRSARLSPKLNAETHKVQGWKIHCCLNVCIFSPGIQYSIAKKWYRNLFKS